MFERRFKTFCAFFSEVLTKDIDNYKTNNKLNKTKLRFIKVTYPWSLPTTEMAKKLQKVNVFVR